MKLNCLIFPLCFMLFNNNIFAADNTENYKKTINITVADQIETPATVANVEVSIIKKGKTLLEASNLCNHVLNETKIKLSSEGIDNKNIISNSFISYPKYSLFTGKIKQYEIEGNITITTREIDQIATILSALIDIDEDLFIKNIAFSHHNEDSLKTELVSLTALKADKMKKSYERSYGVKLELIRISEDISDYIKEVDDPYLMMDRLKPFYSIRASELNNNVPILKYNLRLYIIYEIVE